MAALAAWTLVACASGGSSTAPINDVGAGTVTTTRIEGGGGTAEVRSVNSGLAAAEASVAASPEKVFAALPTVYERLGVPINTVSSDAKTVGARDVRMPRRLARTSLSQYIDCGAGPTGTPNADSYGVIMTVLTRVSPAGAGSTVVTQLSANARPITVSGNTVQCGSTGRLELAINNAVVAEAAR